MARSVQSKVVSLRIDDELLKAVRERARIEGRSVSGEIVFLVRERVAAGRGNKKKAQRITGWLSDRPVPNEHADFRADRARASAQLARAVRRKARRK
jgi:hypothetical protein